MIAFFVVVVISPPFQNPYLFLIRNSSISHANPVSHSNLPMKIYYKEFLYQNRGFFFVFIEALEIC